jgi:ketosteroid isomerase-like protein
MSATDTSESVAVVRGFYEKIGEGKLDEASAFLHEDLVIKVPETLPYGGEYHGPAGFHEDMAAIIALFKPEPLEVVFLDATDPVVIHILGRFTSHETGESLEMEIIELFTVRDGKIIELDLYYKDPGLITQLAASR